MTLFFAVSFAIVLLYLQAYQIGIVQSIEDVSRGLLHPTLILNALLLFVAVYGVLVVKKKFQGSDFGLVAQKLPIAIVVGSLTWLLIQIIT